MRRRFVKVRAIFIALAVVIAAAIGMSFIGEPQLAQIRKTPSREIARIPSRPVDKITAEIRKSSNNLFQIPVDSAADRENVARLGTIVSDHDSFVIALANDSISAEQFSEAAVKIPTTVHLPGSVFDPLMAPPVESVQPGTISKFGPSYFVVQLGDIATDEILDSVRASGFEIIQYVPHNAFIVYGESSEAARVAENSRVRWMGELTARDKFAPSMLESATGSKYGTRKMYNVAVFSRADLDEVAQRIGSVSGGQLMAEIPVHQTYFNIVRVQMRPALLDAVASIPDVVRIDPWIPPMAEDERAAQIVAGNYTSTTAIAAAGYNPLTQFLVDGLNVTVAVADDGISIPGAGGFYITSTNTVDANLRGSTSGALSGHGHLNASIIAGAAPFGNLDPTGYNYGIGIAPKANILNIPLLKSSYTGTEANAANDAVSTVGPNGVKATISNNSWGAGTNLNGYDSSAALYDGLTRDASSAGTVDPLLFVFSAGNCGTSPNNAACSQQSGLTIPKVAKNIIAVGSSENLRTELQSSSNNIDDASSFSSKGPAADGRVKPDILAPGDAITGGRAGNCSGVTSCFETNHVWSNGTSHSAPQVSGVAALFTQFWKGATGGLLPSPAVTKAAILLSGQEMNGVGTSATLPNGVEGWGRVNMQYILNTGAAMRLIDQNQTLSTPGQSVVYNGKIVDGSKPFRAALVWTDPPGTVDPALVNNLDLSVTLGGITYRGNVFEGGLSVSGGGPDSRNNVEQVRRPGTAADTQVSVSVTAAALNGDGAIGNGDTTDQHFALVLYNYLDAPLTNFGISGRVMTPAGRGIANVNMVLSSGSTVIATTYTNSFGYFAFFHVPGNQSYTVSAVAKRYRFGSQNVNLGASDLTGLAFTSIP
jgi:hypothetical protein